LFFTLLTLYWLNYLPFFMPTFKITIIANPYFKNPVLIQTENYTKKEFENALKQYMFSWLWLNLEETNQIEKIQDLFFQKEKTFPLKIAGHKWELEEIEIETGEFRILENKTESPNTEKNQDILEPITDIEETATETAEVLENSETETENLTTKKVELEPELQSEESTTNQPITVDNLEIKNFDPKNKKSKK